MTRVVSEQVTCSRTPAAVAPRAGRQAAASTGLRTGAEPGAVVLGTFGQAHLGDTLCTSAFPRLLHERSGRGVYVKDHPVLRAVFKGNPFVRGFAAEATVTFDNRMRGSGHVLQRLAQGLELPVSPIPKPEIYLDAEERNWAEKERRRWPPGRPVCVLSTSALTDAGNLRRVDWESIVRVLGEDFTIVQPVLTEPPVPGTIPYPGLSLRQYMSLIAAADRFVGGTSGGSHVAAAFDVPSLIVAWRHLLDHLRFPVAGQGVVAAFLYPQQWFIAAEDVTAEHFREAQLRDLLRQTAICGRKGRPSGIGNHPRSPCGFAPAVPRRAVHQGVRFGLMPGPPRAAG
jgi:hypothetical protein